MSREENWQEFYRQQVEPFWASYAHQWIYQANNNLDIYYVLVEKPDNDKLILLSPGRCETYLKYQELIYDLAHAGYNVLAVDHRGQGQSSRELADNEKGYIGDFSFYADDLHQVVQQTQVLNTYQDVYLLAHSMGSTVALDYLYRYQPNIKAAILNAPLLGINTAPIPAYIAPSLISFIYQLQSIKNKEAYFFGQKPYQATPFSDNELCHSQVRYQHTQAIFGQDNIRLGGVTTAWLNAALTKFNFLHQHSDKLNCPVLLLQAEHESIVNNQAQNSWQQKAKANNKDVELVIIEDAKHEILQESENIREQALDNILSFFDKHN